MCKERGIKLALWKYDVEIDSQIVKEFLRRYDHGKARKTYEVNNFPLLIRLVNYSGRINSCADCDWPQYLVMS